MLPPLLDLSSHTEMQTIISDGRTTYQGHPTTVLMPDGKTLFCVWTIGHGGPCGPLKKSTDGGRSWSGLLPTPANWRDHVNCPTIWHLPTMEAPLRLVVYAQEPGSRRMVCSLSEDGGKHWTPMKPCGGDIISVMPWTAILPTGDGRLVGLTNARDPESSEARSNRIIRSYSCDNGLSWTPPEPVTHLPEANLCEPWVLPSPDGREWACLLRANNREYPSMVIFSRDHGTSWSEPRPLPEGLRGDRHIARYLPDGRILAVFRNVAPDTAGFGHFCGWVGRWEDLKNGTPGELQLKLLHHAPAEPKFQFDCGYPGLELLPDGTVVAVTYLHRRAEDAGNSVVSMRIPSSQLTQEFSYEAAK